METFKRRNSLLIWWWSFVLLSLFVFNSVECKTVATSANSATTSTTSGSTPDNVFVKVAKSLASEALSELESRARRNPRLGFNITMLLPPNLFQNQSTVAASEIVANATRLVGSGLGTLGLFGLPAQIGVFGLKGLFFGIKNAIIQTAVMLLFIVFLIMGIIYFASNVGVLLGPALGGGAGGGGLGGLADFSGGGGGKGGDPFGGAFSKNGYEYQNNLHRTTNAVYNAIDDLPKKYT